MGGELLDVLFEMISHTSMAGKKKKNQVNYILISYLNFDLHSVQQSSPFPFCLLELYRLFSFPFPHLLKVFSVT